MVTGASVAASAVCTLFLVFANACASEYSDADRPAMDGGASTIDAGATTPGDDDAPAGEDAGPDGAALSACRLDAVSWRSGEYQIVTKGRLYTLDGSWNLTGVPTGTRLDDIGGFRDGPCVGQAAGACRIDALTWRADASNYTVIRGAKFWTLDANFALIAPPGAAGEQITVIPTIASGPCASSAAGTCSLQAYTFRNGSNEYYLIRDARIWAYNSGGEFLSPETGTPMANAAALTAMCTAAGPGCSVDDVTWRDDLQQFHYFAAGKLWATDVNVASVPGSGADLRSLGQLAQGPCAP